MNIDGSKYEGSWENDRINGSGTCWYPNGNRYEGQWLNGKIHGAGICSSFVCQLLSNLVPNMVGVLFMANGDKYSGEWKDGKRHGQGNYSYRLNIR
jgi:hypothetical protein